MHAALEIQDWRDVSFRVGLVRAGDFTLNRRRTTTLRPWRSGGLWVSVPATETVEGARVTTRTKAYRGGDGRPARPRISGRWRQAGVKPTADKS